METKNIFKIGDDVIAHIARMLQLSLLTGTDIVDHLRMIKVFEGSPGVLSLDQEYKHTTDGFEKKLLEEAAVLHSSNDQKE